ncbi:CDGSH iron-sulfur domain-containing protein [Haloferula sp. BvORR071]|uniref:CDGSH iron-sulfur domain-containing protein n=1 Tax=Haloferula sp. BvORR071 TaxID=1396141 RepID=UPI000556E254|nr:CDGSH iron-sulfur domain-containing protein [Haloferula sp. BvORR071]
MPEEPVIGDSEPQLLEVEAGVHFWCACGHSGHLPFCDGSHKGTGIQPVRFVTAVPVTVAWCPCKHGEVPSVCEETKGP